MSRTFLKTPLRILAPLLFVAILAGAQPMTGRSAIASGPSATGFEAFTTGSVNGQGGWTSGHGSSTCPLYDEGIVSNTYGYSSFGTQSLRISNAIACGSYNDQTFSPSLTDEAGETSASTSTYSGGTRQSFFEAEWDFASTVPGSEQPGLSVVASADRGDPSRMSWLQMQDTPSGLQLNFEDYQESLQNFVVTPIATSLDRTVPHSVRMTIQFVDGPSNDVVKVYLDGALVYTGTTWEDYYRDFAGGIPAPVDSIMFRVSGTAAPANSGNGFLLDNFSSFTAQATAADLTGLTLSSGTLAPAFDPATTAYSASVDNATTSDVVSATTTPGATAVVTGGSSLVVGANTVTIAVTAADGTTTKTYTVTITRAPAPPVIPPTPPAPTPTPPAPTPTPPAPAPTPPATTPVPPKPTLADTRLVVRVGASRRVRLATRHSFTPLVLTTIAAKATVSLTGNKHTTKTYATWSRKLHAGANYLTLSIPAHLKLELPGTYRLTFRVKANGQSRLYSVAVRLGWRVLGIPLPKREADVLLVKTASFSNQFVKQLSSRYLVKTADPGTVFTATLAPNERIGTVVLDANEAGLDTIRHLHFVFPDLHIVAVSSSPAEARLAKAAGASMAVVGPTSADQLSALLNRAVRTTLGK